MTLQKARWHVQGLRPTQGGVQPMKMQFPLCAVSVRRARSSIEELEVDSLQGTVSEPPSACSLLDYELHIQQARQALV